MFVLIGFVIAFGSVIGGFMLHGGNPMVLVQVSEFIIIGGAGLGAMICGYPPKAVLKMVREVGGLIKGNPYKKEQFAELLKMLYEVFQLARKEGQLALERHVEDPEKSELFTKYPFFVNNHHAVSFLSDTLKVVLTGTVNPHDLAEALELDLERYEEEALESSHILKTTGDAMPGFGIVAAVLGVVITMGKIGGDIAEVGSSVAAALVGTFLGVLFAYTIFNPLASATESIAKSEGAYLACIKAAVLTFVRGEGPMTCIEFARRSVEPQHRPTFTELETLIRGQ